MFYALVVLDMNVKNGGFSQYYYNSAGKYLDMSLLACKKMGLNKYEDVIEKANKVYLENNSKDSNDINFTESNRTRFSELNKEYYHLEIDNQMYKVLRGFIKSNKQIFISK